MSSRGRICTEERYWTFFNNMEKQRLLYIDQLRGLVMLMVVLVHLSGQATVHQPEIESLMSVLGNFRMPLFFFVSGYIINKVTKIETLGGVIGFYIKKAKNLLIPTVTWTLIVNYFFFTNSFRLPSFEDIKVCFSPDNGHLWFLTTLFSLMLTVGPYRLCIGKGKRILSIFVLVLFFVIYACIYFRFGTLKNCTLYSPYFFGGMLVSSYPDLEKFIRNNWVYAISLILFCCTSGYWISGQTSVFNVLIRAVSAVTAIVAIYNLVNRVKWNGYVDKLVRLIGVNTLSVYVAHWYFLDTVTVASNWLFALLQMLLYSIVISLVCVGIDKLLSNLKVFRFMFYGRLK